jgi:hypothetical protein
MPSIDDIRVLCGTDDICKVNYAIKYSKIDACYLTATKENANDCITKISVKNNDITLCRNSFMKDEYDFKFGVWTNQFQSKEKDIDACESNVIIKSMNFSDCLNYLQYPNECIENIALRDNNILICNNMIEEPGFINTKDSFIEKCKNIFNKDYTRCKYIKERWIVDNCILKIAQMINDSSICKGSSNSANCEKQVLNI